MWACVDTNNRKYIEKLVWEVIRWACLSIICWKWEFMHQVGTTFTEHNVLRPTGGNKPIHSRGVKWFFCCQSIYPSLCQQLAPEKVAPSVQCWALLHYWNIASYNWQHCFLGHQHPKWHCVTAPVEPEVLIQSNFQPLFINFIHSLGFSSLRYAIQHLFGYCRPRN